MEHFVWSDAYSVGVYELNDQHMRLVGTINRMIDLASLMKPDEAAIKSAYLKVLDDMVQYANVHFGTEERYMQSIGFPAFDDHVEEHKQFFKKTTELKQKAAAGEFDIPGTSAYLQAWLTGHILHSDMAYRKFKEGRAK